MILILFLTLFSIITYHNKVYGLAIIIILLPTYLLRFSIFNLPTTLLELMILILFLIFLIKDKKYQEINFKLKKKSFNKIPKAWRCLLLLWIIASLLGLVMNPTLSALGIWRAYFLEPLMFFIVFLYSLNNKKEEKLIFNSFIILISYLFLIALYQYFTNWNLGDSYLFPNIHRLTSLFPQPNMLALLIAPLVSFLFVYGLEFKNKLIYILPAFLGFLLILFTKSQGALIALILSLLFYFLLKKNYRKNTLIVIIIGIVFFSLFFSPRQYFHSFKQQLFTPGNSLEITSLEIRSHLWQSSWQVIKDNYLLGIGLRNFQGTMINYHKIDWLEIYPHPHNIFLNIWLELGLFGLIVFLFIIKQIFISLQEMLRRNNKMFYPLALAWLTLLIHGLVDLPYFKNDLSFLFFILLGLTILNISNED